MNTEKGKPFFENRLTVQIPEGDFQDEFSDNKKILYFSIGKSRFYGCGYGGYTPSLAINDKICNLMDIPIALHQEPYYSSFYEKINVVIRADRDITMGIIEDIKRQLRLYNHVDLLYATYP